MKKIILILVLALTVFGCGKNKTLSPQVHCIFTEDYGVRKNHGCAETEDAKRKKMTELSNQGYTVIKSEDKNSCSECK